MGAPGREAGTDFYFMEPVVTSLAELFGMKSAGVLETKKPKSSCGLC